jgi:hypothetical protein
MEIGEAEAARLMTKRAMGHTPIRFLPKANVCWLLVSSFLIDAGFYLMRIVFFFS